MNGTDKEASLSLVRAISYPVTRFARSSYSPLRRFYTGMAHAGLKAGLTGTDLLPKQRWSAAAILGPHLSGVSDYEVAKVLSGQLASKAPGAVSALGGAISKIPSYIPETVSQVAKGSLADYFSKLPANLSNIRPSSPILRNVLDAAKHTVNPSPAVRWLQQRYSGRDVQHSPFASTVGYGALKDLALSMPTALTAGPETLSQIVSPLITGAGSALPEGAAGHMVAKGALNTFLKIKSMLLRAGYNLGVNARTPFKRMLNKGLSEAAYFANPTMAELAMMGTDVGNAVREAESLKWLHPDVLSGISEKSLGIPLPSLVSNKIKEFASSGMRAGREAAEKKFTELTHVPFTSALKKDIAESNVLVGLRGLWDKLFRKQSDFGSHHAYLIKSALSGPGKLN